MNAAIAACLIILFGLSVPVAVAIGLSAMFGISFFSSMPLLVVPQKIFTSLDSFPLLAVPFFILAGNLMSRGGVSARLVDFAKSLIGGMQGGLASTCVVTCMIFAMLIGASLFSLVFHELGGADRVEAFLANLPGGQAAALFFVMAVIFVMGFFLDFVEISIIVLPLVIPTLLIMGIDPVWLAVMIAINLQTSFMTPPFGFSLFYLRGAAPREVRTLDIYKGAIPFVLLNVCGIGLVYLFPIIGTWLPGVLFP